jgi:formate hydrogenlyase subunit 3/multisubunit Na+/H+ antiporter MnhD subunit
MTPPATSLVLAAIAAWLAIGVLGLFALRKLRIVSRVLFPAGAAVGVGLAIAAFGAIGAPPQATTLPLGLPELPFHVRVDALSAFFLVLLGAAGAAISWFSSGYFRSSEGTPPGLICFQYHVFLAAMAMVLVADDAYAFMVAWEAMALASYFLVTTEHRIPEIRRAGFLYLLIAHIGAIAILLCFGVLQGGSGDYTFGAMRGATLSPAWASIAFFLALAGFGAKAGLLPLHVWLPEAHPAAPSPVSALMSGVMLKTAIYGLLRVAFDLVHAAALVVGRDRAVAGLAERAVRRDLRGGADRHEAPARVLVDREHRHHRRRHRPHDPVQGLRQAAARRDRADRGPLPRAQPRILQEPAVPRDRLGAPRYRRAELRQLGGLIHRMPWVAWLALVGTLAIAGLPPLNGFVSEWLLLQAFLFTPTLPQSFVNMLVPIAAAALVLAGRARRLRHGEVLRRRVPRAAARGEPRVRARRRQVRARRALRARRRLRAARASSRARDRGARSGERAPDRPLGRGDRGQLADDRAVRRGSLELQRG